jgi:hypothetical protein
MVRKYKLPNASPRISIPPHLIETGGGVGVYFNPDEGQEIMEGFHNIVRGFEKKGAKLTEEEEDSIRSFICSDVISPRFVKKLVEKYGDESIASAFLIRNYHDESYVEYLLRRYKGHFYRNRYPNIAFA